MLNYKINAHGSSPPPLWLRPNMINPEQVLRHYRSAQGRKGGTGTSPTVDKYSVLIEKTRFPYENRSLQIECRDCFPSQPGTMIATAPDGTPPRRIGD